MSYNNTPYHPGYVPDRYSYQQREQDPRRETVGPLGAITSHDETNSYYPEHSQYTQQYTPRVSQDNRQYYDYEARHKSLQEQFNRGSQNMQNVKNLQKPQIGQAKSSRSFNYNYDHDYNHNYDRNHDHDYDYNNNSHNNHNGGGQTRREYTTKKRESDQRRSTTNEATKHTVKTIKISSPKKTTTTKSPKDNTTKNEQKNIERIKNWKMHDGWIKQGKSRQDQISEDPKEFAKKFEGYVEIQPEEYPLMPEGTWIRYMRHAPEVKYGYQYRSGGILVRNCYPDYWVLKPAVGRGKNWSVPLKLKNRYFRKDRGELKRVKERKEKLWNAVDTGKYMLLSVDEYKKLTGKKDNLGNAGN